MRIALTYNRKRSADEAEAEFDTPATIEMLVARLSRLGHDVTPVEVGGSVGRLIQRLARAAPDIVFDIAEGERGAFREAFYPALFEQLGLAYTGSTPSTRALCLDKRLAKRVVAAAGVDVPGEDARVPPLIVKPNCEGSSKGITAASVVRELAQLEGVIAACRARYPDVLVEQFVEGRDVSIAWVDGLGWLPEMAYHYDAPVYEYALKHTTPGRVRVEIPAALDDDVRRRLHVAARRAFTALGVTGFARADFRITSRGEVVFLELNPLPSLSDGELFAAVTAMGATPEGMLACILRAAIPIREPTALRAAAQRAG
jgi:D-alanine-D-alanine ligase